MSEKLSMLHGERWQKAYEFLEMHGAFETEFEVSAPKGYDQVTISWRGPEEFDWIGPTASAIFHDDGEWRFQAAESFPERNARIFIQHQTRGRAEPLRRSADFAEFVQRFRKEEAR